MGASIDSLFNVLEILMIFVVACAVVFIGYKLHKFMSFFNSDDDNKRGKW